MNKSGNLQIRVISIIVVVLGTVTETLKSWTELIGTQCNLEHEETFFGATRIARKMLATNNTDSDRLLRKKLPGNIQPR